MKGNELVSMRGTCRWTGPSSVNMAGCSVFEFRKLPWDGVRMGKEVFCLVSGYGSQNKCRLLNSTARQGARMLGKGLRDWRRKKINRAFIEKSE